MILTLKRTIFNPTNTLGNLFIDGKHFCFTCEDVVRPDGVKVMHETAIPAGTYKVEMTFSERFKKVMPILLSVPMFTGIRIHAGNSEADTSGCILVGNSINATGKKPLIDSRSAYDKLVPMITQTIEAKRDVWITIINEAFE